MGLAEYVARVGARTGIWGAWKLSESTGTNLADYSPAGHPLTISGTPSRIAGPNGSSALGFATSSDYAGGVASAGGVSQTFECWVYLTAIPTTVAAIMGTAATPSPGGQNSEGTIWINPDGTVTLYQYNGSQISLTTPGPLALNVWHHIVGTFQPSGMKIRINKSTQAASLDGSANYGQRPFWLHGGLSNMGGAVRLALPSYYLSALSDAETDAGYDALIGTINTLSQLEEIESAPRLVVNVPRGASFNMFENVGLNLISQPTGAAAPTYEYVTNQLGSAPVETTTTLLQDPNAVYPDIRGLVPITSPPTIVQISQLVEADDPSALIARQVVRIPIGMAVETSTTFRLEIASAQMPWGPSQWTGPGDTPPTAYKWMQAASFDQSPPIGQALETEITGALTVVQTSPPQVQSVGIAVEADVASVLVRSLGQPPVVLAIGQVSEADLAQSLVTKVDRSFVLGFLQETDAPSALVVASGIFRPLDLASESEQPLGLGLRREIRTAVETDAPPLPVVPRVGPISTAIGQVSQVESTTGSLGAAFLLGMLAEEGDTAYPLTVVQGTNIKALGSQLEEHDELINGSLTVQLGALTVTLSRAAEQDAPRPLGVTVALSLLEETDSPSSIGLHSAFQTTVSILGESDQAFGMSVLSPLTAPISSTAGESDVARALVLRANFDLPLSRQEEYDQGRPLTVQASFRMPVTTLQEVDSIVQGFGLTLAIASVLLEQDASSPLTLVQRIIVRRIWIDGQLKRVRLVGITDGQGGVKLARESYWDGERRLEFTKETI